MAEKKFKQVCTCKNCGNEAEMEITCSLEPEEEISQVESKSDSKTKKKQTKGHAVCSHCGNEADIWIDL
jgi:transcription elongation factor Elf1